MLLEDGDRLVARRLIVTAGVVDELPAIDGLREHWGTGVLHCPYCHGWEVRDQAIGVIATSPMSVHQALLFSQLTDEITLVTHAFEPDAEAREPAGRRRGHRARRAVSVGGGRGAAVTGLRLDDGSLLGVEAVVVSPYASARSSLLDSLGHRRPWPIPRAWASPSRST